MNRRTNLKSMLLALVSPILSFGKAKPEERWMTYKVVELPTRSRHYVAADCAWKACCDPNLPQFGETQTGEPWDISKPFAVEYKVSAVSNGMWLVEVIYSQAVRTN